MTIIVMTILLVIVILVIVVFIIAVINAISTNVKLIVPHFVSTDSAHAPEGLCRRRASRAMV